jgi:hypothetical protein
MLFVKPASPGLIIRMPETLNGVRLLPDEGAEVPENSYWLRRLLFGDVIKTERPISNGNVTIVEGSALQEHNL